MVPQKFVNEPGAISVGGVARWLYFMVAAAMLFVALPARVFAADGTWNKPAGGDWSDPLNWLGGVPNGTGDIATFNNLNPATDAAINVNTLQLLGGFVFDNPNTVQVGGGGLFVMLNTVVTAPVTITHTGTGLFDFDSNMLLQHDLAIDIAQANGHVDLSGTFGVNSRRLSKSGAGTLTLPGSRSTWSGETVVDAGTLIVASFGALGVGGAADASGTVINAGARVVLDPNVTIGSEKLRFNGGTLFAGAPGAGMSTSVSTANGPVELLADTEVGALAAASTLNLGGPISGTGNLTINQGNVTLRGNSSHTGMTTMNGGTLRVTSSAGLGTGTGVDADGTFVTNAGSNWGRMSRSITRRCS